MAYSRFGKAYQQKRKTKSKKKILFGLFLIIPIGAFFYSDRNADKIDAFKNEDKKPIIAQVEEMVKNNVRPQTKDRTEIKQQIEETLDKTTGEYGYYVYELDTGIGFGLREDDQYQAASTNKIPTLAKLYQEIEKGNISKEEYWRYESSDYETGTGSIQYQTVGTKYTVSELITKTLKESDNVAHNIIIRKVGRSKVQTMLDSLGLKNIIMIKNLASPKDMSILLSKIYKNEVINKASSDEMLKIMTDTLFEKRLPRLLPSDVKVSHKIGTGGGAISDIGIVRLEGRPFVISVYSSGVQDVEEAEKTIGEISKKVYDFEKSR